MDTKNHIHLTNKNKTNKHNTPTNNLYIQIQIKQHPIFKHKNNNLYYKIPINFTITTLNNKIKIPTLNNHIKLKIPNKTQTNKLFHIHNKNIKSIHNNTQNNLLYHIIIKTPINLNKKQKQLLQKLQKNFNNPTNKHNNPHSKNFFNNIKKFFNNLTH